MNQEITFTAGRLGKKIGVCRETIKNQLRKTGLIANCFKDSNGYLQIPYHVAVKIVPAEALAVKVPSTPRRSSTFKRKPKENQTKDVQPSEVHTLNISPEYLSKVSEHYAQIGRVLQRAGIGAIDLINAYKERQGGVGNEKNNPAARSADSGTDTASPEG